ncbi:hypothetical protein HDU84_002587, partial [Entophlyctis sp. JEL0112]
MANAGESDTLIGVLLAVYGAGIVCGSIVFAHLSKYPHVVAKKWLMVASLFSLAAATLLFAFSRAFWMFAVARFLEGFASNGVWVLGLSIVADLYKDDDANLGKAMGFIMAGFSAGLLIGPPIGGALFKLNYYAPFMFCGCLIALDLFGRLLVPSGHEAKAKEERSEDQVPGCSAEEKPKFKALFEFKSLWIVLFLNAAISIVTNGIEPTLPLKLNAQYGFDSDTLGLIWMALIGPQVIGGILGGVLFDRIGMKRTFLVGFVGTAASFFLLAIPGPQHVGWTCATLIMTGVWFGVGLAPVNPGIGRILPLEYQTMGYSLGTTVFAIGICVG